MKTFTDVAGLAEANLTAGQEVSTKGYYAAGDGGGATYLIVAPTTADELGDHTLANTNVAVLQRTGFVTILKYGAKDEVLDAAFDNFLSIQACLDNNKQVFIPEGTFQITLRLNARKDQTIDFAGWIKTQDGTVTPLNAVLSCSEENITLINPLLDGNRDNTTDPLGSGQYTVLSNYGTGFGLTVIGGQLINGRHNIFQGGRDKLRITGTKMSRCGEHLIYMNGVEVTEPTNELCDGVVLDGLELSFPALENTHSEAHYIQCRNTGKVVIQNCYGFGAGTHITLPTFALLCEETAKMDLRNCYFKDITHRAIWHGPGSVFPAGELNVDGCKFEKNLASALTSAFMSNDAPDVNVTVQNCQIYTFFQTETATEQPKTVSYNNCHFTNTKGEHICRGAVSFNDCTFQTTGEQTRMFRVYSGLLKINNCSLDEDISEIIYAQGGLLDVKGLSAPNKTGSLAIITTTTDAGVVSIKDCHFPLLTSVSQSIKIDLGVCDAVIGGLYMPSGGILYNNSGTLTAYGNVNI